MFFFLKLNFGIIIIIIINIKKIEVEKKHIQKGILCIRE